MNISISRFIRGLRYKFDEPYRIRHGFGLSPIRNQRELKALIAFCEHELTEEYIKNNEELKRVYEFTIKLYKAPLEFLPLYFKENNRLMPYVSVSQFIRDHANYYWS